MNRRRCELIKRELSAGLTPAETAELNNLQAAMRRRVDAVAPLPIEDARRLLEELRRNAESAL